MACTPPKMQPVPMTAASATYANVAAMREQGYAVQITEGANMSLDLNRLTPDELAEYKADRMRLRSMATDQEIEQEMHRAAQNRQRIEHALSETRRIFEARDAIKD